VRPASTPREIGLVIRRARRDKGWSQAELADRAGVGRPWLSELERGKPNAQVGRIMAVIRALGMTVEIVPARESPREALLDEID
jgi:HTH-type transcriptional regulator/antitoxin HipB